MRDFRSLHVTVAPAGKAHSAYARHRRRGVSSLIQSTSGAAIRGVVISRSVIMVAAFLLLGHPGAAVASPIHSQTVVIPTIPGSASGAWSATPPSELPSARSAPAASFAVATTNAPAPSDAAAQLAAFVNQAREAQGAPVIVRSPELDAEARRWAEEMAANGRLRHSSLRRLLSLGFARVGENVGRGNVESFVLHETFLASPAHRSTILDPRWTVMGVGAVTVNGELWATEVFGQARPAVVAAPAASTNVTKARKTARAKRYGSRQS